MGGITSYLLGVTPQQNDGTTPPAGANGANLSVGVASTVATELPKAAVGVAIPQPGGTNVIPNRYADKVYFLALAGSISIRFGPSGVGAAVSADFTLAQGIPYVYTRPLGVTHFRAISEDGATTCRLKYSAFGWEGKETT